MNCFDKCSLIPLRSNCTNYPIISALDYCYAYPVSLESSMKRQNNNAGLWLRGPKSKYPLKVVYRYDMLWHNLWRYDIINISMTCTGCSINRRLCDCCKGYVIFLTTYLTLKSSSAFHRSFSLVDFVFPIQFCTSLIKNKTHTMNKSIYKQVCCQ